MSRMPGVLAVFAAAAVFASQVSFQGLESDAKRITRVLAVKVVTVKRWQEHQTLRDGGEGPVQSVHLEATCDVERVVRGTYEGKTVMVRHTMMSGAVYDDDGKLRVTKSFSLNGSGLEQQLKEGERYVIGLPVASAGQPAEVLVRADKPDAEKALLAAVDAAQKR